MIVAALRVFAGTTMIDDVAVIDRGHETEVLCGRDGNADAGRCERIGGTAVGKVDRRDRGPTPGSVDEGASGFGDDELAIGGQLPGPNRHFAVEKALLKVEFEDARGRSGFDETHRHEGADTLGGDARPVDVVDVHVEGEALQTDGLAEVGIEKEFQASVIVAVAVEAARSDAEVFADVIGADGHAIRGEPSAKAGRIAQFSGQDRCNRGLGQAALTVVGVHGEGCGRQQVNGERSRDGRRRDAAGGLAGCADHIRITPCRR